MKKGKKAVKPVTIVGYVRTFGEEDEGIEICTDENDYIVEMDKVGKRLHNYIDKDVEVTGTISKDDEGNEVIKVTEFDILETEDEGDDDYDDDRDERYDD